VNRILATRLLEKRGYTFRVVEDGRQALETLKTERFDVLLTDIQRPQLDGFELTSAIRTRARRAGLRSCRSSP